VYKRQVLEGGLFLLGKALDEELWR
jgi:hypothetical protein